MKCLVTSDHVFIDGEAKSGQRRRHQRSSHASTTHEVDRAVKCAVFAAIAVHQGIRRDTVQHLPALPRLLVRLHGGILLIRGHHMHPPQHVLHLWRFHGKCPCLVRYASACGSLHFSLKITPRRMNPLSVIQGDSDIEPCQALDYYPNATIAKYGLVVSNAGDADRVAKIKMEVHARGTVATSINADPLRNFIGGKASDDESASRTQDHVISIVGWGVEDGKEHWIIRNR